MAENIIQQFTTEKFDRVDELLQRLKQEANDAHEAGDMYMLDVYQKLLNVCSPVVVNAKARLEREEKAAINKKNKELHRKAREEREAAKAARNSNA